MKKGLVKILAIMAVLSLIMLAGCGNSKTTSGSGSDVTITYWQYTFPTKVKEIKKLMENLEKRIPKDKEEENFN